MALKIVLVHPMIPQNTGNIARLTAATRIQLHLIHPLGFELSDRYLKRAGLDYWSEASVHSHMSWEEFLAAETTAESQLWFMSTKGEKPYHTAKFSDGDFLVFGNETIGLPEEFHKKYEQQRLIIPMDNAKIRSLNLANSVSIVLFEARRQLGLLD